MIIQNFNIRLSPSLSCAVIFYFTLNLIRFFFFCLFDLLGGSFVLSPAHFQKRDTHTTLSCSLPSAWTSWKSGHFSQFQINRPHKLGYHSVQKRTLYGHFQSRHTGASAHKEIQVYYSIQE